MVSEGYRSVMIANREPDYTHKSITCPIAASLLCSERLSFWSEGFFKLAST